MKKWMRLVGLVCLISSVFVGCSGESTTKVQDVDNKQEIVEEQNENKDDKQETSKQQMEEQTDKADSKNDDPKEEPTIQEISRDEWIEKNIKVIDKNLIEASEEFAKKYVKERYKDYIVNVQSVGPKNGYSVWGLSDVVEGGKVNCIIDFTSIHPVEELEALPSKGYSIEITVLMVKKDKEVYLSGYMDKDEYDKVANQQEYLYTYFKQDQRFEKDVNAYFSSMITEIKFHEDLTFESQMMVADNMLALVCSKNSLMVVNLYDIRTKNMKTITIKECDFTFINSMNVVDNKLIMECQKSDDIVSKDGKDYYKIKKVELHLDGEYKVNEFLTEKNEQHQLMASNKKSYVYSNQGTIYYYDDIAKSTEKLLVGNASEDMDRDYYYPFRWIDEERFVYGRGGYEWSNGCGIYNITEKKDYPLDIKENFELTPVDINGSYLITIMGEMGPTPNVYKTNLNNNYMTEAILPDEVEEISSFDISPDGNTAVFLNWIYETDSHELILWSIKEDRLITTYKIVNGIADPSQVSFIDNNNLILSSSRRYACDNYIRIMKIDNNEDDNQGNNNADIAEEIERKELDINDLPVIERLLKPNQLMVEISEYTLTNSVDITSHDFFDEEMKDFPFKNLYRDHFKQEVISLENVEKDLFDKYTNILMPRLVKDGIVFIVRDLENSKVVYLMKYQFSDTRIHPIYTIDGSNYERFTLEDEYEAVNVKTTDKYIIYRMYNDAIIYDIENNSIKNHIRYSEQITDDIFDMSSDGEFIAFMDKEQSLIVSDIHLKKPKMVMKRYDDPKGIPRGSEPRYPDFSMANPHLLTFHLQGYEWINGNMLYNVIDETLVKLPHMKDEEIYIDWVSDKLFIASPRYGDMGIPNGFINLQQEYLTLDMAFQPIPSHLIDYGMAYEAIGVPIYDENKKITFLDISKNKMIQVDNIERGEELVSISPDGQYLIRRPNDGSYYELSKIVKK